MSRGRGLYFIIPRETLDGTPGSLGPTTAAVLDMLRYDSATVESNAPPGFWLFHCDDPGPHVARWQSFGVSIPERHIALEVWKLADVARAENAMREKVSS